MVAESAGDFTWIHPYILGGKLTYELVRINLAGALPHLVTLNRFILNSNLSIKEGEFQFDRLQQYLNSNDVQFGFVSEPLANGIPIVQYYQSDSFDKLKTWFSTINETPLLNIHMFQPLPSSHTGLRSPFLNICLRC
jgi:hypothetical protein